MFRCSHTIIRGALFVLAKVTVVKIANYGTFVCDYFGGDVVAYITRSY
jgi:DNA-binding GntR family transcriptional regulator